MIIKWTEHGWRVSRWNMSFIAKDYAEAFFFIKYQADIDANFLMDYILND